MSDEARTLVIVLSMHRSGSSLSTSILQAHGMSLGPFELLGARHGNPHGHFEAEPILELSREVQSLTCGFPEVVPDSPEILARFLAMQGAWDDRVEVPEALVERGRELIFRLIDSGEISGFKDPRTALIWPFWRRVLAAFPEVREVPLVLLRTPHEIAMSLFTRSRGVHSYRTYLDVTALHLRQLAAIVVGWPGPVARVRFGSPHFERDLAHAVATCGLTWDPEKVRQHFHASSVHHSSAVVAHESQRLYEALAGAGEAAAVDPASGLAIIEADAFARESLYCDLRERDRDEIGALRRWTDELQTALRQAEANSQSHYNNWQEAHRSWQEAHRSWQEAHRGREEAHRGWQEAHRGREEAHRSCEEAHRGREEAHRGWMDAIGQLAATREELEIYRRRSEETRELAYALSRQLDAAHVESVHLQSRLLRFDSHPLLGPILRGRRRVKSALKGLRIRENGP